MKILTIGNSPYNNNSCSKIHASIIKKMLLNGHQVSGACWNHDTSYYYQETDGYFYNFSDIKVPLNPYNKDSNEVIVVYELIKQLEPDVIIGIGDINDFYFMKAIKNFSEINFKWILILTNYNYPIIKDHEEIVTIADSVFCTNKFACNNIVHLNKNTDWAYYGSSSECYINSKKDSFNICLTGLNHQIENIPAVIKSLDTLYSMIPNMKFYLHTNLNNGDHNISSMIEYKQYISTPTGNVSAIEDYSDREFCDIFNKMHVIVSASMVSSVGHSLFNAMACGVVPILSNTKFHNDLIQDLVSFGHFPLLKNDMLIDSLEINAVNDYKLKIIKPESFIKNIYNVYNNLEKINKYSEFISDFATIHSKKHFLNKFNNFFTKTICSKTELLLEPV